MNKTNVVLSILIFIFIIMNLIVILGEDKQKDPIAQQIKAIGNAFNVNDSIYTEKKTELIRQLIEKSNQ